MSEEPKPTAGPLDEVDRAILTELQREGRISLAELGRRIDLSGAATHSRIRRLEQQGYVRGYAALLDRELAGYDMLCLVRVSLERHQPETVEAFRRTVQGIPEVIECYHVTGDADYVLKVAIRNRKDLERFLVDRLTGIPGVARLNTSVVLTAVKETTVLPLG